MKKALTSTMLSAILALASTAAPAETCASILQKYNEYSERVKALGTSLHEDAVQADATHRCPAALYHGQTQQIMLLSRMEAIVAAGGMTCDDGRTRNYETSGLRPADVRARLEASHAECDRWRLEAAVGKSAPNARSGERTAAEPTRSGGSDKADVSSLCVKVGSPRQISPHCEGLSGPPQFATRVVTNPKYCSGTVNVEYVDPASPGRTQPPFAVDRLPADIYTCGGGPMNLTVVR